MTITAVPARTDCPRPDKRALTQAEAAERVRIERHTVNFQLSAYQCTCGAWHLGKDRERLNKQIKRVVHSGNHKHTVAQQRGKRGKR
jgi:hypothetical protein